MNMEILHWVVFVEKDIDNQGFTASFFLLNNFILDDV